MKRGLPKKSDFLLENYFSKDTYIYVHPGIPKGTRLDRLDLEVFAAKYEDFIATNIDRLTYFTEISGDFASREFVDQQRRTAWSEVPPGKFLPVWSSETGLRGLKALTDTYLDIAISGEAIEHDSQLASATRLHATKDGSRFHALGCAKPDNLRQVKVETASTLSWLSPMMHGETIIWDGTRLVRYPKKMKEQARLAVWSYEQFEMKVNRMTHEDEEEFLYDKSEGSEVGESGEKGVSVPDNKGVQMRKIEPRNPDEIANLPVFGYKTTTEVDDDGVIQERVSIETQGASLRQCDTCFIASNCPAFKPQSMCAFKLPIEVKTKDQLKALLNAIIEMQGQRVAFMRFAEEMNGGYADPNLSQEIDRLYKLVAQMQEMGSSKEFIRMTVERQGSAGVLSSIFGDKAQALKELPNGGLNEVETTEIIRKSIEE
jgi:hypothetical protein